MIALTERSSRSYVLWLSLQMCDCTCTTFSTFAVPNLLLLRVILIIECFSLFSGAVFG